MQEALIKNLFGVCVCAGDISCMVYKPDVAKYAWVPAVRELSGRSTVVSGFRCSAITTGSWLLIPIECNTGALFQTAPRPIIVRTRGSS